MTADFGVTGNGEMLVKVRGDGALTEAFYPSIGFFRHIIQSQFGIRVRATNETFWLSAADCEVEQRYLDGTNVLRTRFETADGVVTLTDFMPVASEEEKRRRLWPEHELVRRLECERGDAVQP